MHTAYMHKFSINVKTACQSSGYLFKLLEFLNMFLFFFFFFSPFFPRKSGHTPNSVLQSQAGICFSVNNCNSSALL